MSYCDVFLLRCRRSCSGTTCRVCPCQQSPSPPCVPCPTAFNRCFQPLLIVEYIVCQLWHLYSCPQPPNLHQYTPHTYFGVNSKPVTFLPTIMELATCAVEEMTPNQVHASSPMVCHRPWYYGINFPDKMAPLAKMQDRWSKRQQTLCVTQSQGQSNQ